MLKIVKKKIMTKTVSILGSGDGIETGHVKNTNYLLQNMSMPYVTFVKQLF